MDGADGADIHCQWEYQTETKKWKMTTQAYIRSFLQNWDPKGKRSIKPNEYGFRFIPVTKIWTWNEDIT